MSHLQWFPKTRGRLVLILLLLSGGTAITVVGSQREAALLVVAGVAVIVVGLRLSGPLAQKILDWLDQRGV
ncbi:MAG: hypothetical protein O7E55_00540 [Chloroflexi bacterium]|nr:hypothetical protein [Chloroflexota bacterium]